MPSRIERKPVTFPSVDGVTTIHGYIWTDPANNAPKGVVQLVHGMAEHIERYDNFARFLASNGFVVAGHTHLGHGKSVTSKEKWGSIPAKDGARILVEDAQSMRIIAQAEAPANVPYFIFGHSMGSFVTRSFITRYADGLSGAIICGTGHIPPIKSKMGNLLARMLVKLRGEDHKSKLLEDMSVGAYSKAVKDARTPLDWLSYDTGNVDAYIADEECGFSFSVSGNATLTALTGEVCDPKSVAKIPHDLPLLYIAGAEDPVGDMSKGVHIAAEMAREAGVSDVDVRIYENMRHEILNEANSQMVYDDVLAWLEEHAK